MRLFERKVDSIFTYRRNTISMRKGNLLLPLLACRLCLILLIWALDPASVLLLLYRSVLRVVGKLVQGPSVV